MYHLLRHLAARHEVTVLGYGSPEDARDLGEVVPEVRAVRFLPPPWPSSSRRMGQLRAMVSPSSFHHLSVVSHRLRRAVREMVASGEIDALHAGISHMASVTLGCPPFKVMDAQNVEHDVFRRNYETLGPGFRKLHYWLEWHKHRREEIHCCRGQDLVLTTSRRDAALLGHEAPGVRYEVVPNGVDLEYFAPSDVPPEPATLVFTGTMDYLPNLDGITWFLDRVLPIVQQSVPSARILVVGKAPPASILRRASEHVTVTGYVDDVRPFVCRATACVVPLRSGGGTRTKILEAFAMRKAVVSTSVGCEGIDVDTGRSILIADDPETFASATVALLTNPRLRGQLAEAGRAFVRDNHDWTAIGRRLADLYDCFPVVASSLPPAAAKTG
jgi:glycosyltransferase involved in cell wall biosynthesis